MSPDFSNWPVPAPYGAFDHPPTELPTRRKFAVTCLDKLASIAEGEALPKVDGELTMLPESRPYRTPEAFVSLCLEQVLQTVCGGAMSLPLPTLSGVGQGQATAVLKLWRDWADSKLIAEKFMLFEAQLCRHLLSPMRGDLVVFSDGHCAIVTEGQCSQCKHFRSIEFTPHEGGGIPSVFKATHWLTTVVFVLRLVLTPEDAAAAAEAPKGKGSKDKLNA